MTHVSHEIWGRWWNSQGQGDRQPQAGQRPEGYEVKPSRLRCNGATNETQTWHRSGGRGAVNLGTASRRIGNCNKEC
eukprot:4239230-Amphidinium_carterae.1